jgi:hypothetical protein
LACYCILFVTLEVRKLELLLFLLEMKYLVHTLAHFLNNILRKFLRDTFCPFLHSKFILLIRRHLCQACNCCMIVACPSRTMVWLMISDRAYTLVHCFATNVALDFWYDPRNKSESAHCMLCFFYQPCWRVSARLSGVLGDCVVCRRPC